VGFSWAVAGNKGGWGLRGCKKETDRYKKVWFRIHKRRKTGRDPVQH